MNTVRVPTQARSIETKNKLEAAAKKLFSQKGFHSTNAKEIASEAGVSVGSFYSYYENKKALFMEIFRRHSKEKESQIINQTPVNLPRTKESVHQIIRAILDANDLSPEFHREVMALRYSDPEVEAFHQKIHARFIANLADRLRLFKDYLRVDDLETAATVVCSASEDVMYAIKTIGHQKDEQRLVEALSDMIFRYLFK